MARIDWALACDLAFFDRQDRLCIVGITRRLPVPRLPLAINQLSPPSLWNASQLAYCSSTVAENTMAPISPMTPATMNGMAGSIFHSRPPTNAAGLMATLRIR
jgi:hypothetical protein